MAKIIYDSQLVDLLSDLSREAAVMAPVSFDRNYPDEIRFEVWSPHSRLKLNYAVTVLPPTAFLMPSRETLFRFEGAAVNQAEVMPQILFGLSLEDLEGISRLDKVMRSPVIDEPYQKRREDTRLIGLDKYTAPANLEFDLYFQEIEPGVYGVTAKTKWGKRWLATKHFRTHQISAPRTTRKTDPLLADPDLPQAIKHSREHPVWQELTDICFGCGICSYVCPLCYCADTHDEMNFGEAGCGERCRSWDSCMLKSFADTTHHNFRPELKDRIYNWYYHKFYRMPREYHFSGCADCNRCTVYCPANINYRLVLSRILADYKKRPQK